MKSCFCATEILLPPQEVPVDQWGCLACDQFTSQPAYWQQAASRVENRPSTLHIILPEVYLEQDVDRRIQQIHATMQDYQQHLLTRKVNGFVYVERTLQDSSIRQGLVGAVDLEAYSYQPNEKPLIRPTEKTVLERIPPRMAVRQQAPLESPHIMMLVNDPENTLVEAIAAKKQSLPLLYQGELAMGCGFLSGWAVDSPELIQQVEQAVMALCSQQEFDKRYPAYAGQAPLGMVVGDGNHSLATAKACWEQLKKTLPKSEWENHPARYCLAEVCNVHSPAIQVEAIHRVVFGANAVGLMLSSTAYYDKEGIVLDDVHPQYSFTTVTQRRKTDIGLRCCKEPLAAAVIENFLDWYTKQHPNAKVDYIHGEDAVEELVQQQNAVGIVMPEFCKNDLFAGVIAGGVLPKKTFSIGKAKEKRCYFECRAIR